MSILNFFVKIFVTFVSVLNSAPAQPRGVRRGSGGGGAPQRRVRPVREHRRGDPLQDQLRRQDGSARRCRWSPGDRLAAVPPRRATARGGRNRRRGGGGVHDAAAAPAEAAADTEAGRDHAEAAAAETVDGQ